jgi:predicted ribonuclease YlaK
MVKKEILDIKTKAGKELNCSYNHLLLSGKEWKYTKDIIIGDKIETKDGEEVVISKEYIGRQLVYDIEVDSEEHRYYTNDIISHNTGKTVITVAACLHKVMKEKKYEKVIFLKPTVTAHEEIGFLKGTLEEKMRPFMSSFIDNINVLRKGEITATKGTTYNFEEFLSKEIIEIENIGFIRGRSFNDCIIVADEMQNVGKAVMKTIMTRLGENARVIVLGDIEQIDPPYLSKKNNGISHLIDNFKNQPFYGHVTLVKTERSVVSEMAAKLL